jgi:uncharacterized protein
MSGILCSNQICRLKYFQSAWRDITEISYRCRNNIETGFHVFPLQIKPVTAKPMSVSAIHPIQPAKNSMRACFSTYRKLAKLFAMAIMSGYLVSGCGSSPTTTEPVVSPPDSSAVTTKPEALLAESKYSGEFATAEEFLLVFDWMAASNTLSELTQSELSRAEQQYLQYLQARILYLRGDQDGAAELTGELSLSSVQPALGNKVHNFQRHMIKMSGDSLASARLGDTHLDQAFADRAEPAEIEALSLSIWRDLQETPGEKLRQALDGTGKSRWQAWLGLALLTAEAQNSDQLERELTTWLEENPQHPGADALPGGLGYLLKRSMTDQKVALMLPLSGRLAPVAKAVRDGYLANYYGTGADSHELLVVDLDRYESVVEAYEELINRGASLVIGPLSKHNVARLGAHPNRPVPILALNQVDEPLLVGKTALVQLALAPEDEAAQIAQLAFGRGARRAMVIRPRGSWGDKMERALLQRWQGLGGQLGSVATYSGQEDYSSSMAGALHLAQSEQRARDVRSMLATNIEFTARPRQDVDTIFLLSRSAGEARSLKPLLAYHYVGDLPVYATSSIYRGASDPADKDLNGTQLVEIPWLMGAAPELRFALGELNGEDSSYTRLNALGADAFLLQSRFDQLQAGPQVQIRGNTGLLSLDPGLRIQRHLQPAKFDRGVLRAQ